MGETSSNFRDALLEVIDTSQGPVDHPSPDQWIAYQRGELPAEEEARLQEHLVRCRDCFDLAAGAAEFVRPEEPDAGGDVETEALWRLVKPQLDPPPPKVQSLQRPSRRFQRPTLLAASFFVALVGMTVWSLRQGSEIERLKAPRANVPTVEFDAGERVTAGRERSIPAEPQILKFHPAEDLPAYRLVIREAAMGRELSSHELLPDRDLAFNLYLPEGLAPGLYRLELLDGAGKVRETYLLRVMGD